MSKKSSNFAVEIKNQRLMKAKQNLWWYSYDLGPFVVENVATYRDMRAEIKSLRPQMSRLEYGKLNDPSKDYHFFNL